MLKFHGGKSLFSSYKNSQANILRKYPVGAIYHGFEIKRILPVPELQLTAIDFEHQKTGAHHLHIDRDDNNNVLSVAFKTNPPNSTGVPHILEHTTLCGSAKYPVRDPFFKMLNRSLSNFMNAMTAHDYTFYPFATTNPKDFSNLRDVYLDATFNPLLKETDFYQEGWRLEHEVTEDRKTPLVFKGVVYNEMKGQVSNASYYFWIKFQEAIYPSLNNSGGDPRKITDLYHHELVDFHHKNYHPSNCKSYTYGNFPVQTTLRALDEKFVVYGKRVKKTSSKDPILLKPIDLPETGIKVKKEGQLDPMLPPDKQLKMSITWICGDPSNIYETFLLKILGNLLFDGQGSPFYQKLVESGLGYEYSVNTGVESTTANNFITIGVQGCNNVERVRKVILETFQTCMKPDTKYLESHKIEAIVNQLELSKKDEKANFGLGLLYSLLPGWVNKTDPFDALLFDEIIEQLRNDFKEHGVKLFQDILTKYVIDKPSFEFVMKGVEDFSEKLEQEELGRLNKKIMKLDEQDKEVIYNRGLLLKKIQSEKEDLSSLPSLQISDISKTGSVYPVHVSTGRNGDNIKVYHRITHTNGISYLSAKKSLNTDIPPDLLEFLPLFTASLTSLGTSKEEFTDIEDKIKFHTGGVSIGVNVHSNPIDCKPELTLNFSGWSLNSKVDHIFDFWSKLLIETDFHKHKEKLKTLIKSLQSNTSGVAESGHLYAGAYASASLSRVKSLEEKLFWTHQSQFINKISHFLDDGVQFDAQVVSKLKLLKKHLINSNGIKLFVVTDDEQQVSRVATDFEKYTVDRLNEHTVPDVGKYNVIENFPVLPSKKKTLINFPFQVHYVARALPGVPYIHKDGPKLQVLSKLLTFKYLHREIREKGGAYGGGATYSGLDGIFSFYSYRDPHPIRSLEIFENCNIESFKWTEQDLNEAKLTIFQSIDAPTAPKAEGSTFFNYGVTDEMKQQRRDRLLDVKLADVFEVGRNYLSNAALVSEAVVGPRGTEKEFNDDKKWDIVEPY
ncbi:pitrilysin family metalloprotease SCDLUD_003319 [Saccharomycodes ludwigii]|uniref:pitrilysin family metalloprotease n=1 Tax=Saccharomycodes ludwigii TaxID=36035 RepID=UPI001E899B0C|nr:hypothetical protein SCDLUD_003319 [Saccharomycodes ludwigii]KAH3900345.1 hypothetical protein SCDLUD_003319 [Saccharomycodes ludwigii]